MLRQWGLLLHLRANRYATVATLAQQFQCSTKTIRRDIAVLQEAGFPIHLIPNADDTTPFVRLNSDWLQYLLRVGGTCA
jgi:predicted DNA-binding transcriptional regulator YafY